MQKITDTCQPRQDILTGTFNPEIFTASLAEVIRERSKQKRFVSSARPTSRTWTQ